jgi:hypothetical protein
MIMFKSLWRIVAPVVAIVLLGLSPPARADTVEVNFLGQGPPGTFNYLLTETAGATMQFGDYFAVIDFDGYIPGSATPLPGFTVTTTATGPGASLNPDSAGIVNVVYTYTTLIPLAICVDGLLFSLGSIYTTTANESFTSQDHKPVSGLSIATGDLTVAAAPVPLPMAAWAGMALMGLVGANKFRLSRRVQV